MGNRNTTGFPSPAQGYEKETFDFNRILVQHPSATFTMRYDGKALTECGLFPGDLIIVDSAVKPQKGMLAVVEDDGEFKCERLEKNVTVVFGIVTGIVRTGIL
jgi:DNA polymerase V